MAKMTQEEAKVYVEGLMERARAAAKVAARRSGYGAQKLEGRRFQCGQPARRTRPFPDEACPAERYEFISLCRKSVFYCVCVTASAAGQIDKQTASVYNKKRFKKPGYQSGNQKGKQEIL